MNSLGQNRVATAEAVNAVPRSRRRIGILALLAVGTMINYLDRTVLGIAAPQLTQELGISAAVMGIVFSAFAWTYALAQIPGGMFLDRFGNKVTYFLALSFWSLFTLFHGFAVGLKTLLLCRFGLGVSEAPCFPVNSRVVSAWFPQHERAKATAVYTVGEYLGLACFAPLLFWIMDGFGWRTLFITVGVVGLLFALVWWRHYREPHEDRRLSQQEREYITAGGGMTTGAEQRKAFSWPLVRQLLRKRQIIGASIGQFAGNTVLVFFLTWFPTYLVTERHMPWLKVGFFAILPFLAAAGGVMFGGWVSDKLLKATGSANLGRKLPIIAGLLMASCIISANWLTSDTAVILVMSFAFFGQGMVGLGWTLISDMAPKGLGGLTGGLFNFCANLAGILTPLVIGFIVAAFGSFFYALVYIGGAALLGVVAYLFILGDVKRIELDLPEQEDAHAN
ncbi:MFS transporter [Kluyvera georgiana]|uniref:MFS transporter n=1 Tax=Kluyvera georgiana TaxID=73098 RepID=UPI00080712F8|nr:MFS transporter [Kluyvera georgiana]